jgi:succinoglycan biosynthesis protein ExoW
MDDERLAVIIPFFQLEPGILARALASVRRQRIPSGWVIEVIVVDDGSPCPANGETADFRFDDSLKLRVIRQDHAGVAAARNRGLEVAHPDTALIAFLDSDDIWPPTHLMQAIRAITAGYDFCFTDSRRSGHYESYLRERANDTGSYIAGAEKTDSFTAISSNEFIGLMSKEFPAQISTVVYRRCIAPTLRFEIGLQAAGEDLLFLCMLLANANNVAFDQGNCVECGIGLNIFFSNLSWDNPKSLAICVDQFVARRLIDKKIELSPQSKARNNAAIKYYGRRLALETARNIVRYPSRVPKAIADLSKKDALAAISLPLTIFLNGLTLILTRFAKFG